MNIASIISVSTVALVAITSLGMYGCPKYRIYSQTSRGEADLREAEWSKKIQIEEARGKEDSATMIAQARITQAHAEGEALMVRQRAAGEAEVVRAKSTAEANTILGESLKNNEAYLRYLWIQGLQDGTGERIYIPTEAGMPILEAGKAGQK